MKTIHIPSAIIGCLLAAAPVLRAQESQTAPEAPPPKQEAVRLDPFDVTATQDNSYAALNSNSLTAFNTSLDHLPVTADIMDQTFMQDTGVQSIEGAIMTYDAGAAFQANNVGSTGESQNQPGDHSSAAVTLWVRGFPIGGILTNGLQLNFGNPGQTSFEETSNYDIDRIEIVQGPQALLYTGGGPGGAINIVTKQAYIGQPAFGTVSMRFDQYGSKYATFDYGASSDNVAVRVALVDGTTLRRRVNIGDELQGGYVQVAARLLNTTFRVSLQQSVDARIDDQYMTLTSSGDPNYSAYNGDHLEYLLAQGLGPKFMGGGLNWGNAESLGGVWESDDDLSESAIVEADSTWTDWLATKLVIGGANFADDNPSATESFYSPGATANPLPGNWTIAMPSGTGAVEDVWRPKLNKSINFNILFTNELFGGKAKSQTSLESDYAGNENSNAYDYSYFQADSNFNVVTSATRALRTEAISA